MPYRFKLERSTKMIQPQRHGIDASEFKFADEWMALLQETQQKTLPDNASEQHEPKKWSALLKHLQHVAGRDAFEDLEQIDDCIKMTDQFPHTNEHIKKSDQNQKSFSMSLAQSTPEYNSKPSMLFAHRTLEDSTRSSMLFVGTSEHDQKSSIWPTSSTSEDDTRTSMSPVQSSLTNDKRSSTLLGQYSPKHDRKSPILFSQCTKEDDKKLPMLKAEYMPHHGKKTSISHSQQTAQSSENLISLARQIARDKKRSTSLDHGTLDNGRKFVMLLDLHSPHRSRSMMLRTSSVDKKEEMLASDSPIENASTLNFWPATHLSNEKSSRSESILGIPRSYEANTPGS